MNRWEDFRSTAASLPGVWTVVGAEVAATLSISVSGTWHPKDESCSYWKGPKW